MAAVINAADNDLVRKLADQFPGISFVEQRTFDDIPTLWVPRDKLLSVLPYLIVAALLTINLVFWFTRLIPIYYQPLLGS